MSKKNPETDVEALVSSMTKQAHRNAEKLPKRFTMKSLPNQATMRIRDTVTNKKLDVFLCNYIVAIEALAVFMPDSPDDAPIS